MDQFFNSYVAALQNYVNFSGRTSLAGFWRFVAVNLVIAVVLWLLINVSWVFFPVYLLYGLAMIIPSIAIGVRRLHDTGKSGWMILLGLIPLVGFIILIVLYLQPGETSANQWGPPAAPGT